MAQNDGASAESADGFSAGVNTLRDTAKWTLTIFAGVAAVLTAGSQLSNIGQLDVPQVMTDNRLLIAIGSGILVLLGLGIIIWQAITVLTTGGGDFSSLTANEQKYLADIQIFGTEFSSFSDVAAAAREAVTERAKLDWTNEAHRPQLLVLESRLNYLNRLVARATSVLRYQRVAEAFRKAARWMLGGGALTAIAVVAFVWATNPPAPSEAPEFVVPANATLNLTEEDQDRLATTLGEACVAGEIPVVILSSENGRADVVTVAQGECKLARFETDTTNLQRQN